MIFNRSQNTSAIINKTETFLNVLGHIWRFKCYIIRYCEFHIYVFYLCLCYHWVDLLKNGMITQCVAQLWALRCKVIRVVIAGNANETNAKEGNKGLLNIIRVLFMLKYWQRVYDMCLIKVQSRRRTIRDALFSLWK